MDSRSNGLGLCGISKAVSIVFASVFIALSPTTGLTASAPLEKLTIGWSAIAGSQAPFWITKEAGLFEKNGLDVIMIYLDGGSRATQAMMSGDLPIAQVGGNAPVVAKLRGADITLIAGLTQYPRLQHGRFTGDQKAGRPPG